MTTIEFHSTAGQDDAGAANLQAPACPRCDASSDEQSLIRADVDGAFFRVDYLCDSCNHDHPVWYDG